MSKVLTVTISDFVYYQIEEYRSANRSEFVEELIRLGLSKYKKAKNGG